MSEITQDENCHLGIRETAIVDLTMHGRFHRLPNDDKLHRNVAAVANSGKVVGLNLLL